MCQISKFGFSAFCFLADLVKIAGFDVEKKENI